MYPKNLNHIAEISSLFGHFNLFFTSLNWFQANLYCKSIVRSRIQHPTEAKTKMPELENTW